MSSNVLFFGWSRSIPGREQLSERISVSSRSISEGYSRMGRFNRLKPSFLTSMAGT